MITVIIPALNEESTIESVVRYSRSCHWVSEVIVVDDNSTDQTAFIAEQAGAKLIKSKKRGKGISMKEGVDLATGEIIVFLDADIDPYPVNAIYDLAKPIRTGDADFVKGAFSRDAGRVTELVAKPLLTILFPGLALFGQPLGGMIGGKTALFRKIEFLDDYGVDVGILIDMFQMQARIHEVNIGYIPNKSQPWHALIKMSHEVAGAILRKAFFNGLIPSLGSGIRHDLIIHPIPG